MMMLIEVVKCPNCGASFEPEEEGKQRCPYCDVWLVIEKKKVEKKGRTPVPNIPMPDVEPLKKPEPERSPWRTTDNTCGNCSWEFKYVYDNDEPFSVCYETLCDDNLNMYTAEVFNGDKT